MIDALTHVLNADERVRYALLFGSRATGRSHPRSDVDVAVALSGDAGLDALLALASRLEGAAGGLRVDLVDLDRAGPVLAFRVFRDGRLLLCRDRTAFVERKARAISLYLDFRPVQERLVSGALEAARGR
ncbi:MAG: nucleotidyltransferase domain-containing protein [Deltaproteobacteria bacterium]|nr:nucleotidyltransferase domain-containing protein [Deltaproteobacteria bacterium]MBW2255527.1 nucleotidyltransferase domain-containing protein [Deltaproteobacteria bacterium]